MHALMSLCIHALDAFEVVDTEIVSFHCHDQYTELQEMFCISINCESIIFFNKSYFSNRFHW